MNPKLLCTWLGLPGDSWPPNHHALLDLPPGETDPKRVEEKVQERLAKLRCYQLSHPEEATEGMNRLAQAFISLTEARPAEKPVATATALADPPPVQSKALQETLIGQTTKLDWADAPPVRVNKNTPLPAIPIGNSGSFRKEEIKPAPPPKTREELQAEAETALVKDLAESTEARGGLVTLPDVIERIERTRRLLTAWIQAGRFVSRMDKLLGKSEKAEFVKRLKTVTAAVDGYPSFVAHPGQPGYRVVALAHLAITPEMFNAMHEDQRDLLAKDWSIGYRILIAHRSYVRRLFKSMRRNKVRSVVHAARNLFAARPLLWTCLGGSILVAMVVSVVVVMLLS